MYGMLMCMYLFGNIRDHTGHNKNLQHADIGKNTTSIMDIVCNHVCLSTFWAVAWYEKLENIDFQMFF